MKGLWKKGINFMSTKFNVQVRRQIPVRPQIRFLTAVPAPVEFSFRTDYVAPVVFGFRQPWSLFSQGTFVPESNVFRQLTGRTAAS
jgi:hypothetical protein